LAELNLFQFVSTKGTYGRSELPGGIVAGAETTEMAV